MSPRAQRALRAPRITPRQLAAGVATGLPLLLLAALSAANGTIDARAAAAAFALTSAALLVLILLNTRASTARERHLVEVGAALRLQSAMLEEIARSDAVTGIANRRGLMTALTSEVYRALRYHRPLAVLMIDIDHFKFVNDRHGHEFGDRVLADVAHTLERALRASDHVARYGGEEFVVVLPESDASAARVTAEKLRALVDAHEFAADDRRAHVTVSVGVATLVESHISPTETARRLIARADMAMYAAKRAGRNRVRVEDPATEVRRAA